MNQLVTICYQLAVIVWLIFYYHVAHQSCDTNSLTKVALQSLIRPFKNKDVLPPRYFCNKLLQKYGSGAVGFVKAFDIPKIVR